MFQLFWPMIASRISQIASRKGISFAKFVTSSPGLRAAPFPHQIGKKQTNSYKDRAKDGQEPGGSL